MEFLVIWLAGDFFNIIGAVLQKVLPTMIILAIYYTFADILLIAQCFYYRGFSFRDPKSRKPAEVSNGSTSERTPLIGNGHANGHAPERLTAGALDPTSRTRSQSSFRDRFASLDGTGLSPATPMHPQPKDADETEALKPSQPRSWIQAILFNSTAIVLVVLAGVAGYYLSPSQPPPSHHGTTPADDQAQSLHFSFWGQIFGYICAVFYLGSRVPQILLNYRRKSTEGNDTCPIIAQHMWLISIQQVSMPCFSSSPALATSHTFAVSLHSSRSAAATATGTGTKAIANLEKHTTCTRRTSWLT